MGLKFLMKSSLIILTYNELEEGTIPCIKSIYKYTNIEDFELIIVDNASKDGTRDYLKELKEKHSNVKIQLNNKNKGFAAGMNDGLRLAEGDYLFILNNDILVTPGWLEKLTGHLENNDEIGLIGPITNGAGNEQGVEIDNLNKENYIELTQKYTERQKGQLHFTKRLAFFCVGMKRQIFQKVGFLDEKFGIGWFEDDDYCFRVAKAGHKIAIVEDCFIYHYGSLSFSKASSKHASKNVRYFSRKHDYTWTPMDGAISYIEKIKNDINKYSNETSEINPNIERIKLRLNAFESYLENLRKIEAHFRFHKNLTIFQKIKFLISKPERYLREKIKNKFKFKQD